MRARLGLKSTGFNLGVLRLDGPTVTEAQGKAKLSGVARDVDGVVLERRVDADTWVKVNQVKSGDDGSFEVAVRLDETTAFRLRAGELSGPVLTVRFKA